MISGLLTLILIAATASAEGTPDSDLDHLLATLAAAQQTAELHFRERRESPLLSEPLIVTGRLWRNPQGQLVRQTTKPREATYTLTANMIMINRPGQAPRNYSLGHVPELAVLYHGLSALLSGNAHALRERFEHELGRTDDGWLLSLAPRDPALAEKVESLAISGQGDKLERFELKLADGEAIQTELSR